MFKIKQTAQASFSHFTLLILNTSVSAEPLKSEAIYRNAQELKQHPYLTTKLSTHGAVAEGQSEFMKHTAASTKIWTMSRHYFVLAMLHLALKEES